MTTRLQDIHLLTCSLLPGELLVFTEDAAHWNNLLDLYASNPDSELDHDWAQRSAYFQVKLAGSSGIWFDVELPPANEEDRSMPIVSVKGDSLGRTQQERWQAVIADALKSIEGSEYPSYELISTHLLPQLHASLEVVGDVGREPLKTKRLENNENASVHYHALFVSHHLKSPQKRRSLSQWSHDLSLAGFAKLGHPGVIYCEGAQQDVEDFLERVKGMQWLALRLRFVEPVPQDTVRDIGLRQGWAEFEKVGEVVDAMRQLGRESFVIEMGIGSVGTLPSSK